MPEKNDRHQPFLFRAENISRSLGLFLPATFAARFLGLLRGIVLAWLLARSEFALLQISLLVINILNPLCSLGMNEAVARYVPHHENRGTLGAFLRRIVPLVLVLGLLGSLLGLPQNIELTSWATAWGSACIGVSCDGLRPYFWNSLRTDVPCIW